MRQNKLYLRLALKSMLLILLLCAGWIFLSAIPLPSEDRNSSLIIYLDQLSPGSLQSYSHAGQVYFLLKRDASMQASLARQQADYGAEQERDKHPALMRNYQRSLRADYLLLQIAAGCKLLLNDMGIIDECTRMQYGFSGLALLYPEVLHLPVPGHELRGNVLLLR